MPTSGSALRQSVPALTPAEKTPTPASLRSARQKVQSRKMNLIAVVCFTVLAAGMIYMFGHYQLVRETFRQNALRQMLGVERERLRQVETDRSNLLNPAAIGRNAAQRGMVPGNDREMVSTR